MANHIAHPAVASQLVDGAVYVCVPFLLIRTGYSVMEDRVELVLVSPIADEVLGPLVTLNSMQDTTLVCKILLCYYSMWISCHSACPARHTLSQRSH